MLSESLSSQILHHGRLHMEDSSGPQVCSGRATAPVPMCGLRIAVATPEK